MNFWQDKVVTTDDVCPSNLKFWEYWGALKSKFPELKVIAFVIANASNKELVSENKEFLDWFERTKDWVEIGVHGYDHEYPPECERENQEELIEKALSVLRPFLPNQFLYRAPGFQVTNQTEPILKKLGFAGIAHQGKIKYFDGTFVETFDTHCCNKYANPITELEK